MEASILSIGDEILLGQIMNTNAAWMSSQLTSLGIRVRHHIVIGDQFDRIQNALDFCNKDTNFIFITGGLGPTHDDITVESLAKYLKSELIFDEDWFNRMKAFFVSRGRVMPDNNRKQAFRPKNSIRIDNEWGTAPGHWIEKNNITYICTPGVPYEMEGMFRSYILPKISKLPSLKTSLKIYTRNLFTTGMGESLMAAKLDTLTPSLESFLNDGLELAWLPSPYGVKLRFTVKTNSEEEAQMKMDHLESHFQKAFGDYIFAKNSAVGVEVKLEEVIGTLLNSKKKTLALAESCTGGLTTSRLTDIAGSSNYIIGSIVSYSNQIKTSALGVSESDLTQYGAVSDQVARAMANGIRNRFKSDYGLSITGIAGPDGGTNEKPVGTVWIALATKTETFSKKFTFEKDRLRNKIRSSQAAMDMLRRHLSDIKLD